MDTPLQEFDFDIVHTLNAQHVIANYLSRMEDGKPPIWVIDDFPNANLFKVHIKFP